MIETVIETAAHSFWHGKHGKTTLETNSAMESYLVRPNTAFCRLSSISSVYLHLCVCIYIYMYVYTTQPLVVRQTTQQERASCAFLANTSRLAASTNAVRLMIDILHDPMLGWLFQSYHSQFHDCFYTIKTVPELTLKPPVSSQNSSPCRIYHTTIIPWGLVYKDMQQDLNHRQYVLNSGSLWEPAAQTIH